MLANSNKRASSFQIFTYDPELDELIENQKVDCTNDVKTIKLLRHGWIFTGHRDGGAKIWKKESLKRIEDSKLIEDNAWVCKVNLVAHQETVSGCSIHPDDKDMILTCGYDQKICYWDISGVENL